MSSRSFPPQSFSPVPPQRQVEGGSVQPGWCLSNVIWLWLPKNSPYSTAFTTALCKSGPLLPQDRAAPKLLSSQVVFLGEDLVSLWNPGNRSRLPLFYMSKITTIFSESYIQKAICAASEKHFASKLFLLICMHFYK